jgi:hypothetical protein
MQRHLDDIQHRMDVTVFETLRVVWGAVHNTMDIVQFTAAVAHTALAVSSRPPPLDAPAHTLLAQHIEATQAYITANVQNIAAHRKLTTVMLHNTLDMFRHVYHMTAAGEFHGPLTPDHCAVANTAFIAAVAEIVQAVHHGSTASPHKEAAVGFAAVVHMRDRTDVLAACACGIHAVDSLLAADAPDTAPAPVPAVVVQSLYAVHVHRFALLCAHGITAATAAAAAKMLDTCIMAACNTQLWLTMQPDQLPQAVPPVGRGGQVQVSHPKNEALPVRTVRTSRARLASRKKTALKNSKRQAKVDAADAKLMAGVAPPRSKRARRARSAVNGDDPDDSSERDVVYVLVRSESDSDYVGTLSDHNWVYRKMNSIVDSGEGEA